MPKIGENKCRSILLTAILTIFLMSLAPSALAQGGPPMLTDDPGTPGDGMWEVNFLSTVGRSREGWMFETPVVDVNYGVGPNIQLKFEAPWVVIKESGELAKTGPGNSMIGVKWRFLNEEADGIDVSTYPQLEFNNPTRSSERGLVDRGLRLFLPVEALKRVGPVEVNGEVGYGLAQYGADEWEYGLAVGRQVTKRIELMAELHGSTLRNLRKDELFFNAGSRVNLGKNIVLLFSAGKTIRSAQGEGTQYLAAVGIQFNFRRRILSAWKR